MILLQNYFRKIIKARRCESIFEIIIAITVISIGTSAITLLVTTVMRANSLSKEFLIANNLATEGLEAMSNMRESNWIEFPGYETDCWNVVASVTSSTSCTTAANKIGGSYSGTGKRYFIPEIDDTYYTWTLTGKSTANALTSDLSNATKDDPYRLYTDGTTGIYSTDSAGTVSPFYRMVTIQYLKDNSTIDTSDDAVAKPADGIYMDVISLVEWEDHVGGVHTVKKTIRLFNHVSS